MPPAGCEPATPALGDFPDQGGDLRKRCSRSSDLGKLLFVVVTCSQGFPSSCVRNPFCCVAAGQGINKRQHSRTFDP